MSNSALITLERLKELLSYDPDTGIFRWRVDRQSHAGKARAGSVAGQLHPYGFYRIGLDGRRYKSHRLAWFYVHGAWPQEHIDHINCDATDNRLVNLREATLAENNRNTRIQRNNTTGFKGVTLDRRAKSNRFIAQITVNRRAMNLGHYPTAEAAHAAYVAAAQKYFGAFARAG